MTTATQPTVTDEQARILAAHAHVVQGGFSTPEIERERLLKDAAGAADPQQFIDETVGKFAVEMLQAQLFTADRAPTSALAAAKLKAKALGPDTYTYEGEVLDIPPAVGYPLLERARETARALHVAKEAAKSAEQEVMQLLGGHEHGAIDGQQFFHWPFVDSTSFDVKSFKEDPERKSLYERFLKVKRTRRFRVEGTVGVD